MESDLKDAFEHLKRVMNCFARQRLSKEMTDEDKEFCEKHDTYKLAFDNMVGMARNAMAEYEK